MTVYFFIFAGPTAPHSPTPEDIPIEIWMVGSPTSSVFLLSSTNALCTASAQSTARLASLGPGNGTPNVIVAKEPLLSVSEAIIKEIFRML